MVVVDDSDAGDLVLEGAEVIRAGGLGFARAVNLGLDAAQARGATHALLLNDDAVLEPGSLDALRAAWGPGVGAVGPVLLDADGAVESAGFHRSRWGRVRVRRSVPPAPTAVQGLSGACLLVGAGERLDVAFAHGMEDLDLCSRLARRGLVSLLVPSARCRHVGGATLSRRSPEAQRAAVSGHLRLVGGGIRSPIPLGLALAQVAREGGSAGRLRGIWRGWRDWRRR